MRSPSEKRFFRKSEVSETWTVGNTASTKRLSFKAKRHTVDGPPMLSITIAKLNSVRNLKPNNMAKN